MAPLLFSDRAVANSISAIATLTSDYRLRGVSLDDRQITPQLEVDLDVGGNLSFGTIASKVDFNDNENTSIEVDLFTNKHWDLNWIGFDLGAFYYSYPNHTPRSGSPQYSMVEVTSGVTKLMGPFTLSISGAWSPNYFGETGNSWYVSEGAEYQIETWLKANAHFGQQWVQRWNSMQSSGFPYQHWDFGITANYGQIGLDLRYVGVSLSRTQCLTAFGGSDWCENAVVGLINYRMQL